MGFTVLKRRRGSGHGRAPLYDRVTMGAFDRGAGHNRIGFILVGSEVVGRLGWSVGDIINIAIGEGEDAGWYAFTRADADNLENGIKLTFVGNSNKGPKRSACVRSALILRDVATMPATDAAYEIRDGVLCVKVPVVAKPVEVVQEQEA